MSFVKFQVDKLLLVLGSLIFGLVLVELSLQGYGLYLDHERNALEPELEGKIRILALGESTTDSVAAPEKKPWTYFLERKLNENSTDKKFVVINKGRSGTSTHFILRDLPEQLKKFRPHLVITMMGINDVSQLAYLHDEGFISRLKIVRIIKNLTRPAFPGFRKPPQEVIQDLAVKFRHLGEGETFEVIPESIKAWMENNPGYRWYAYQELTRKTYLRVKAEELTGKKSDFSKIFSYGREALKENPADEGTLQLMIYSAHGQFEKEMREIVKDLLRRGYSPTAMVAPWFDLIDYHRDSGFVSLLEERGLSRMNLSRMDVVRNNYIQSARLIRDSGARLAVMGYPTSHIELYRKLFRPGFQFKGNIMKENFYEDYEQTDLAQEFRDIIFIENSNFPKTYDKEYYTDLMVNEPRGSFGHTTMKGHELIGSNAARVLLKDWVPGL